MLLEAKVGRQQFLNVRLGTFALRLWNYDRPVFLISGPNGHHFLTHLKPVSIIQFPLWCWLPNQKKTIRDTSVMRTAMPLSHRRKYKKITKLNANGWFKKHQKTTAFSPPIKFSVSSQAERPNVWWALETKSRPKPLAAREKETFFTFISEHNVHRLDARLAGKKSRRFGNKAPRSFAKSAGEGKIKIHERKHFLFLLLTTEMTKSPHDASAVFFKSDSSSKAHYGES